MAYDDMQGTPMDVEDHPAYSKPQASIHMAGEVIPFPKTLSQEMDQRVASEKAIKEGYIKPRQIQPLKGPGAN